MPKIRTFTQTQQIRVRAAPAPTGRPAGAGIAAATAREGAEIRRFGRSLQDFANVFSGVAEKTERAKRRADHDKRLLDATDEMNLIALDAEDNLNESGSGRLEFFDGKFESVLEKSTEGRGGTEAQEIRNSIRFAGQKARASMLFSDHEADVNFLFEGYTQKRNQRLSQIQLHPETRDQQVKEYTDYIDGQLKEEAINEFQHRNLVKDFEKRSAIAEINTVAINNNKAARKLVDVKFAKDFNAQEARKLKADLMTRSLTFSQQRIQAEQLQNAQIQVDLQKDDVRNITFYSEEFSSPNITAEQRAKHVRDIKLGVRQKKISKNTGKFLESLATIKQKAINEDLEFNLVGLFSEGTVTPRQFNTLVREKVGNGLSKKLGTSLFRMNSERLARAKNDKWSQQYSLGLQSVKSIMPSTNIMGVLSAPQKRTKKEMLLFYSDLVLKQKISPTEAANRVEQLFVPKRLNNVWAPGISRDKQRGADAVRKTMKDLRDSDPGTKEEFARAVIQARALKERLRLYEIQDANIEAAKTRKAIETETLRKQREREEE